MLKTRRYYHVHGFWGFVMTFCGDIFGGDLSIWQTELFRVSKGISSLEVMLHDSFRHAACATLLWDTIDIHILLTISFIVCGRSALIVYVNKYILAVIQSRRTHHLQCHSKSIPKLYKFKSNLVVCCHYTWSSSFNIEVMETHFAMVTGDVNCYIKCLRTFTRWSPVLKGKSST